MRHVSHFITIPDLDHIAKTVLHYCQMIEMVVHLVRQAAYIAQADDPLFGTIGRAPKELERDLIDFDQCALVGFLAIEVEVHEAVCLGRVVVQCRVAARQVAPYACAVD
jgi:hypothetical protein